jgi:aspartyl-tRNA(Asn)/glutamyl-tRNA(Gln) amidotransferase subunit A
MALRFSDVTDVLNVVIGPDPRDSTSLPTLDHPLGSSLGRPLTVAWSKDLGYGTTDDEILRASARALRALEEAGVRIIEVDTVFSADPLDPWLSIVGACLDRSFAPFAGTPAAAEADPILQMIVAGGGSLSARGLIEAIDTRHFLTRELDEVFQTVDLLLCPVTAGVTPQTALDGMGVINGETTINWVQYTYPFNMTRSPAASVPIGLSDSGVPIGSKTTRSSNCATCWSR